MLIADFIRFFVADLILGVSILNQCHGVSGKSSLDLDYSTAGNYHATAANYHGIFEVKP